MNELEKIKQENKKLRKEIDNHIKKEHELLDIILLLKTKILDIQNHQVLGIEESDYEKVLK